MAKQSPPFNHLAAAKARDERLKKSPSTPSPSQGVPQRGASGQFTPNTQKNPSKTSQVLSVTTKAATTPSAPNVSGLPVPTTQRQSRNINDSSYRGQQQQPTAPTNRVVDQMVQAKNDPRAQQNTQKNIAERRTARERLKEKPRAGLQPLAQRNEAGHMETFQNASRMNHLRSQGLNQEAGRPKQMVINPRPGRRVHSK